MIKQIQLDKNTIGIKLVRKRKLWFLHWWYNYMPRTLKRLSKKKMLVVIRTWYISCMQDRGTESNSFSSVYPQHLNLGGHMHNTGTGKTFWIKKFKSFSGKADIFNYTQTLNFVVFFCGENEWFPKSGPWPASRSIGKEKYRSSPRSLDLRNQKVSVWRPVIGVW